MVPFFLLPWLFGHISTDFWLFGPFLTRPLALYLFPGLYGPISPRVLFLSFIFPPLTFRLLVLFIWFLCLLVLLFLAKWPFGFLSPSSLAVWSYLSLPLGSMVQCFPSSLAVWSYFSSSLGTLSHFFSSLGCLVQIFHVPCPFSFSFPHLLAFWSPFTCFFGLLIPFYLVFWPFSSTFPYFLTLRLLLLSFFPAFLALWSNFSLSFGHSVPIILVLYLAPSVPFFLVLGLCSPLFFSFLGPFVIIFILGTFTHPKAYQSPFSSFLGPLGSFLFLPSLSL